MEGTSCLSPIRTRGVSLFCERTPRSSKERKNHFSFRNQDNLSVYGIILCAPWVSPLLTMASRIVRIALCLAMAAGTVLGFSATKGRSTVGLHLTTTTSSSLFYVRNTPPDPAIPTPVPVIHRSKVKIETISSLYELQYFLQEDERPVAIK